MFPAAAGDIAKGMIGEVEGKPLYQKWLDGYQGDAYILGKAMVRLIDQRLGRDKLINLTRDYRKLLVLYNQTALKADAKGAQWFVFETRLAQAVASYTINF